MSYFKEKLKIEEKIKQIKIALIIMAVLILLGGVIFSSFVPMSTWKYYVAKPNIDKREMGEMRLHFLDVGQGDATLIELPDGKTMLIDGGNGEEDTAKRIMRYLNALKINTLDYLLVTHADSDHCGALDVVLQYKKVEQIFLPNTKSTINQEYAEFYAAVLQEDSKITLSSRSIILNSETDFPYTLSFLYPYSLSTDENIEQTEENNASSAVVWLDYQGKSALFMGDAPLEVEEKLIRDDDLGLFEERGVDLQSTEILKVAHHGSKYSTGENFLQYLNVKAAVISNGKENLYGHPHEEVLQSLQELSADIYRTDTHGNVVISVSKDGEMYFEFIKNKR